MMKRKHLIISIFGILGILLATLGVTYAFFSYTRKGTSISSITSGNITFLYNEMIGVGNGISLSDAMPMTDTQGKNQVNYFDFKVESHNNDNFIIPYTITAKLNNETENIGSIVKVYLTDQDNHELEPPRTYSSLEGYTNNSINIQGNTEKVVYEDVVPANSSNYSQEFRLRMWIDENADYTDSSINGATFTLTVNVYAEGEANDPTIDLDSSGIKTLTINNISATEVEDADYDYEVKLPEGTTVADIVAEAENTNATVTIKEISDPTAYYETSHIKRLAATNNESFELTSRYNYYKITVKYRNGSVKNSILRVKVLKTYNNITDVKNSFSEHEEKDILVCDYNSTQNTFVDCDYYTDFEKAFTSKTNGYAVLNNNMNIAKTVTIASTRNYVLDLNGKTLTSTYVDETETELNQTHGVFLVSGHLTINDSVGTGGMYTGQTMRPIEALKNGYVVINGGSYSGRQAVYTGANNSYIEINGGNYAMIQGSEQCTAQINSCTGCSLVINGGTFNNDYGVLIRNSSTSTLTINGGVFTNSGGNTIINSTSGKIYITAGSITGNTNAPIRNASTGVVNITGGTIIGKSNGIYNVESGTVNICGGTVKGTDYPDLANAKSTGKIYYKSNVIFTNGAGNPTKGTTGTIALSTTITCQ